MTAPSCFTSSVRFQPKVTCDRDDARASEGLSFFLHSRASAERRTAQLLSRPRSPFRTDILPRTQALRSSTARTSLNCPHARGTCQGGTTSRSCHVRARAAWSVRAAGASFSSLWSLSSSVGPTTGCLPPSRHSSIADGTVQPCAPTIPGFPIALDRARSDRLRGPALGPFLLARTLPPPRTDQSE